MSTGHLCLARFRFRRACTYTCAMHDDAQHRPYITIILKVYRSTVEPPKKALMLETYIYILYYTVFPSIYMSPRVSYVLEYQANSLYCLRPPLPVIITRLYHECSRRVNNIAIWVIYMHVTTCIILYYSLL